MPRGNPRSLLAFRVTPAGRTWLDDLMTETGADRSAILRAVMSVAKRHESELKMLIKERKEEA